MSLHVRYSDISLYLIFDLVFFQAEDGIRDLVRSRGLGDVYKRQDLQKGDKKSAKKSQKSAADDMQKMAQKIKKGMELSLIHI